RGRGRALDADHAPAERAVEQRAEHQHRRAAATLHGACFSTLTAKLVTPSTRARSSTWTTAPWSALASALTTRVSARSAWTCARSLADSSGSVTGCLLNSSACSAVIVTAATDAVLPSDVAVFGSSTFSVCDTM